MFGMSVGVAGVWAMSDIQIKCMPIHTLYVYEIFKISFSFFDKYKPDY